MGSICVRSLPYKKCCLPRIISIISNFFCRFLLKTLAYLWHLAYCLLGKIVNGIVREWKFDDARKIQWAGYLLYGFKVRRCKLRGSSRSFCNMGELK